MSWNTLTDEIRAVAETSLTEAQLEVWKLELSGLSMRKIAEYLDLHRSSATDRLAAAHRKLRIAGVRQDAYGRWYLDPPKEAA